QRAELEGFGERGRDRLQLDADPAARHGPGLDDLFHHGLGHRGWYREPYADRAAGLREDRGIDADQVAARVDQRAARIALVDRGVGLDEVLEGVDAKSGAAEGRNDS